MTDYSPLFLQGLLAVQEHPVHIRIVHNKPRIHKRQMSAAPTATSSRHVQQGRSFLSFHMSISTDAESRKRRQPHSKSTIPSLTSTSTSTSNQQATSSSALRSTPASPTTPTSPGRRALPLPKPAPLASLPAIPSCTINTSISTHTHVRTQSAVPSSHLSRSVHRKNLSLAPPQQRITITPSSSVANQHGHSAYPDAPISAIGPHRSRPGTATSSMSVKSMSSTAVSTQYRKRRRLDALLALEGRTTSRGTRPRSGRDRERERDGGGKSFVPTIEEDDHMSEMHWRPTEVLRVDHESPAEVDAALLLRSHLSFSSWYTAITSPASGVYTGSWTTMPSTFLQSRPDALVSPAFLGVDSTSTYTVPTMDLFDPSLPPLPPRRKSEPAEPSYGWGETFIDLEDDASSFWRWSTHVA